MPVLFAEGPYEDESGYGGYTGTPNTLRRGEYWSLTSGALAGHMWGSYWIDRFDPAWQSHLNSQGTIELGYFKSFITALHWYDLVPDQTHSLITAGYGTYTSTGTPESSNYATGAKTADGTLAVIYTPVSHTLTVALGGFAGPVTAQWYDPTNNTFTNSFRLAIYLTAAPTISLRRETTALEIPIGLLALTNRSRNTYPYPRLRQRRPQQLRRLHLHLPPTSDSDIDSNTYAKGDPNLNSQSYAYGYTDAHTYANTVPYSYGYTNKLYCA